MSEPGADVTVVVPTVGRPSLARLLASLAGSRGPLPRAVLLVDDRPRRDRPLVDAVPERLRGRSHVLPGAARGPAAARNRGWRAATTEWVAFLDDDVEVAGDWLAALADDLRVGPGVVGVQGRLRVPLPRDRRPTDWERDVAGLERARWATADMAYRRDTLAAAGGFDERFARAYREDADLGLRVLAGGGSVVRGRRRVDHHVRPADWRVSVRRQAGNADDALMRRLHGPGWQARAGALRGRRPRHLLVAGAAALAAVSLPARRTRAPGLVALLVWAAGTAELAAARIAPGPRHRREVVAMLATSAVIPLAAAWHWLRGRRRARAVAPGQAPAGTPALAVLFDRDGTLIADQPFNDDPDKVEPMPGAAEALRRLREAGVPTAVVSNQSGVARGLLTLAEIDAVNQRVEEVLGPVGPWVICPHGPGDGCSCRKPAGGLVRTAAQRLGVDPGACVVIGDIGADADAAHAAGARAVLVPTPRTLPDELDRADAVAPDLPSAVEAALGRWAP